MKLNQATHGLAGFTRPIHVIVFDFTKNKKGETSVNTIELGLDGNLTHPISAGWMSAVITKEDRLRFVMEGLPPVRVQEVESKQREVVQVARRLEDQRIVSLERTNADTSAN